MLVMGTFLKVVNAKEPLKKMTLGVRKLVI